MRLTKQIAIFSVVFLLAMACPMLFSDVVPGAVLYLDAADNPAHPDAWTNLGMAGGELPACDEAPELETGRIEIPALDIDEQNVKYYTAKKSGQTFGAEGLKKPVLHLEEWTIEYLCRRNGGKFDGAEEHHLGGFQNTPVEGQQGIRLKIKGSELRLSIHQKGSKKGNFATGINLKQDKWTWIAITSEGAYQNGEKVGSVAGNEMDKEVPIDTIVISANRAEEKRRCFNGSIAIVRVYDKALDEDEIMQNIRAWVVGAAVDPASKLTTTWGAMKMSY